MGTVLAAIVVKGLPEQTNTQEPGISSWIASLMMVGSIFGFVSGVKLLACIVLIWRQVRYAVLLPCLALCWATLGYFAYDVPASIPPDLGPVAPADAENRRLYYWLVKDSSLCRIAELYKHDPGKYSLIGRPKNEWRSWVSAHGDLVANDWSKDTVGREWVDRFAHISEPGVIHLSLDGPCFAFIPLRGIYDDQLSYALWLSTTGRCDEAAKTLANLLQATYNLQRTSTGLVTTMMASAALRLCYEVTELVVQDGTLGTEARTDLLSTLKRAPPISTTVRNGFLGEYYPTHAMLDQGPGAVMSSVKLEHHTYHLETLSARFGLQMVYNRNVTEQEYLTFFEQQAIYAQSRKFEQMSKYQCEVEKRLKSPLRLKNPVGSALIPLGLPPLQKVAERFWTIEEQHDALIEQLSKLAAADAVPVSRG